MTTGRPEERPARTSARSVSAPSNGDGDLREDEPEIPGAWPDEPEIPWIDEPEIGSPDDELVVLTDELVADVLLLHGVEIPDPVPPGYWDHPDHRFVRLDDLIEALEEEERL